MPDGSSRYWVQGWSLSLLLHLGAVLLVATMMPRMTVLLEQEPFRWQVAMVEPSPEVLPQSSAAQPATVEPAHPVPSRPPAAPAQQATMERVAPKQSAQVVHPAIEPPAPPQPMERMRSAPPVLEKVEPAASAETQAKKPEISEPQPVPPQTAKQEAVKEPVQAVSPAIEPVPDLSSHDRRREASPAASAPLAEAESVRPSPAQSSATEQTSTETLAAGAPASSAPAQAAGEPHVDTPPAMPPPALTAAENPPQVAKAAPPVQPERPAAKADHRWLLELLQRRVAELQRYPTSARLNGLEGKVIIKAVIRADGQLAEVTVQKSSGHSVLDEAAMETVKLATPLAMTQPLNRTEIVVRLPFVYSLRSN